MTFDRHGGRWIVRNPETKKTKKFTDEAAARRAAEAITKIVESHKRLDALHSGRPTIASLVTKWEHDKLQFMPWDDGTRTNMIAKMRRISRELGDRTIRHTDCMYLEEWLTGFCHTADAFNKWRYALVLLWKFAVSRKLADACEPDKIEVRSTSRKLKANQKVRQPLSIEEFREIHAAAEPWLQLAMELSLVTLQGRNEVCNMRHDHFRDGHLFVIREKVSGDSDAAFIKIAITAELEGLRSRALRTGTNLSHLPSARPFLVHRKAARERRQWIEGKPHPTYVNPDYLTNAFQEVRDSLERFAEMHPETRPSFHEIRGLGSRIYLASGMPEAAISALMTHSNKKTTEIYLQGGATALRDDDYIAVQAPMRIGDVLK
jgi:integrase